MTTTAPASPPIRRIELPGTGPEDVVLDDDGRLIAGLEDGRIVRVDPAGGAVETLARTAGRPLGLAVLPDGRMLICDSPTGLLRLDPATRALETLVERVDGERLIFCSNVVAARDGTIYFTRSSSRYPLKYWRRDIVENVPTGGLFRRDADGTVTRLLDGLFFANGLVLSPDESSIVVAETGALHLRRYRLAGPHAGQSEIFATLGGFPDNMGASAGGLYWVAIASPANPVVERLHKQPMLVRRLVARLPEALQPAPVRVARVVAFDDAGTLVHDFVWSDGTYALVTGVAIRGRDVYLGSLGERAILHFEIPA